MFTFPIFPNDIEALSSTLQELKEAMAEAQRSATDRKSAPTIQRKFDKAREALRAEERRVQRMEDEAAERFHYSKILERHMELRSKLPAKSDAVFGTCSAANADWYMMMPSATGTGKIFVCFPVEAYAGSTPSQFFAIGSGVDSPMRPEVFFGLLDSNAPTSHLDVIEHISLLQGINGYMEKFAR